MDAELSAGSMNMSYDSSNLTTPDIKVQPTERDALNPLANTSLATVQLTPCTCGKVSFCFRLIYLIVICAGVVAGGAAIGPGPLQHPAAVPAADDG